MRRLIALVVALAIVSPAGAAFIPGRPPMQRSGVRLLGTSVAACNPVTYTGTPLYQSLALADTWTTSATTLTPNAVASPACTTTAAQMVETATAGSHNAKKTVDFAITQAVHTLTFYWKPIGTRTLSSELVDSSFASGAHADVSAACAVTNQYTYGTRYSAINATGSTVAGFPGWCKVAIAATYASADTEITAFLGAVSAGSASYTGDGVSGLYLWGVDFR